MSSGPAQLSLSEESSNVEPYFWCVVTTLLLIKHLMAGFRNRSKEEVYTDLTDNEKSTLAQIY